MAKEKHLGKRVYIVVDEAKGESEVKLCVLDYDPKQKDQKEILASFINITDDDDLYYVAIKDLNPKNSRKKTEYKFMDANDEVVKNVRCDGTALQVLNLEELYTKDAKAICAKYKGSLSEMTGE